MDTTALLAIVGIGGGLFTVLYTVLAQSEDKRVVRDSLRGLDGFEVVDNQSHRGLLDPRRAPCALASPAVSHRSVISMAFVAVSCSRATRIPRSSTGSSRSASR